MTYYLYVIFYNFYGFNDCFILIRATQYKVINHILTKPKLNYKMSLSYLHNNEIRHTLCKFQY